MADNLYEHLQRHNNRMTQLLDRNRGLSEFFLAMADHCLNYCDRHGVKFEDLVVDRPFVDGVDSGLGEYVKARITHR